MSDNSDTLIRLFASTVLEELKSLRMTMTAIANTLEQQRLDQKARDESFRAAMTRAKGQAPTLVAGQPRHMKRPGGIESSARVTQDKVVPFHDDN